MKKRALISVFVAGALILAMLLLRGPADPVYNGHKLTSWLNELHPTYSGHYTQETRETAQKAIRAIGTNGVPCLIEMLRVRDSALRLKFKAYVEKQKLFRIKFRRPAEETQFIAILGIKELGHTAVETVPDLIALADNGTWSVRAVAADALGLMGEEARPGIPVLMKVAQDGDEYVRGCALRALQNLAPVFPEIVPPIEKHLQDPAPSLRAQTLQWMVGRSTNRTECLPLIKAQLSDTQHEARAGALLCATFYTNAPKEFLPFVEIGLSDRNSQVRSLATNMYEKLRIAGGLVKTNAVKRDILFSFTNMPLRQVLDTYSTFAGETVTCPPTLNAFISANTYAPVSKAEALALIESALREQASVVIRRRDDGSLIAQKSTTKP